MCGGCFSNEGLAQTSVRLHCASLCVRRAHHFPMEIEGVGGKRYVTYYNSKPRNKTLLKSCECVLNRSLAKVSLKELFTMAQIKGLKIRLSCHHHQDSSSARTSLNSSRTSLNSSRTSLNSSRTSPETCRARRERNKKRRRKRSK